jgi:hypothetical protein
VEEIAVLLRAWRAGELSLEEALEEVEEALYRNNFAPLLDGAEEKEVGDERD